MLITIVCLIVFFCGVYLLLKNRGSLCKKQSKAAKEEELANQGKQVPNYSIQQSANKSEIDAIPCAAIIEAEMGLGSFVSRF